MTTSIPNDEKTQIIGAGDLKRRPYTIIATAGDIELFSSVDDDTGYPVAEGDEIPTDLLIGGRPWEDSLTDGVWAQATGDRDAYVTIVSNFNPAKAPRRTIERPVDEAVRQGSTRTYVLAETDMNDGAAQATSILELPGGGTLDGLHVFPQTDVVTDQSVYTDALGGFTHYDADDNELWKMNVTLKQSPMWLQQPYVIEPGEQFSLRLFNSSGVTADLQVTAFMRFDGQARAADETGQTPIPDTI